MASGPPGGILPDGWTWSDVGHGALDVLGLVPVIGEGADLANAAWLAAEGDYLGAGLSIIAMVPIVGDAIGKGGKLLRAGAGRLAGPALDALRKMDFNKMLAPLAKHPKIGPHVEKIAEALEKWRADIVGGGPGCTPGGVQGCPLRSGARAGAGDAAAKIAKTGDFTTPPDKSVFYSGPGNRDKALHAAKNGGVPIDATPGGKALNGENLYGEFSPVDNKTADAIWSQASENFANNAKGEVTAFVRGASPDRVFGSTELPLLLKNPNVTGINGIPMDALRAMEAANPGAAFKAVVAKSPL